MRRHTRAVFVLGGWLLMLPPSETEVVDGRTSVKVDTDAPIARWSQDSAYDTARACEDGISGLASRTIPKHLAAVYVAARCVAADAVYTPKEPARK